MKMNYATVLEQISKWTILQGEFPETYSGTVVSRRRTNSLSSENGVGVLPNQKAHPETGSIF
jgi:hypothetical protein